MSHLVSIRIDDATLQTMRSNAHKLHLTQTDYIRTAIERMNKKLYVEEKKRSLQSASLAIRAGSMEVNAEFDKVEHDPET